MRYEGAKERFEADNSNLRDFWLWKWKRNIGLNKERGFVENSVSTIEETRRSAVLCGGGPSLCNDFGFLRGLDRTKWIVVTSAHTLGHMLSEGIDPDYVFVLDAKHIQAEWLKHRSNATLLMEVGCDNLILDAWKGPIKFYRCNDRKTFPELYDDSDFSDMVYGGGNVMTVALYWCVERLKCTEIVFCGHDYCNRGIDGTEYSDGSVDYGNFEEGEPDFMWALGRSGKAVPTLGRMWDYKTWTELFCARHPECSFTDRSKGILGMYTDGESCEWIKTG